MTSTYTGQRRTHLEALAALLPDCGLVGRMVGGDDPVLWVWHPRTGRQTIIFATPSTTAWVFLWSPGGQGHADDLAGTAEALHTSLTEAP